MKEVGYQRKGMNKQFNDHFSSEKIWIYTQYKEFELAYQCIDESYDNFELIRKNFKENFLDTYEEGVSMLWLNY